MQIVEIDLSDQKDEALYIYDGTFGTPIRVLFLDRIVVRSGQLRPDSVVALTLHDKTRVAVRISSLHRIVGDYSLPEPFAAKQLIEMNVRPYRPAAPDPSAQSRRNRQRPE